MVKLTKSQIEERWELVDPALVFDRKSMPRTDFQKLQSLHTAGVIELHDFGAWMSIIF